jgi:LysR family transcriptional activator of mexEF-oprN operon
MNARDESPALARDLDLNLLRVFVAVADAGSVTGAAARLYVTQPAVSAALRRLSDAVGAPLIAKHGRGITLTARGRALVSRARPHLDALVRAALDAPAFDPRESTRTVKLGLSDAAELWLLPTLLRVLEREAPSMRLIVVPVQFRTVGEALATGAAELAVTVADELSPTITRETLFSGSFLCLHDPRRSALGATITRAEYLARKHVVVSYNGDLRGLIEDLFGVTRDARVSVSSFHGLGAVIEETAMIATVPAQVAKHIVKRHPALRTADVPFKLRGTATELLARADGLDDPALAFVRAHIARIAKRAAAPMAEPEKPQAVTRRKSTGRSPTKTPGARRTAGASRSTAGRAR